MIKKLKDFKKDEVIFSSVKNTKLQKNQVVYRQFSTMYRLNTFSGSAISKNSSR